ncbi:MAG: hypothetical protein QOC67_1420 [Pseudonocardiales bacterium]|nr:hypothetical protein [Pseudonocardiales bacterium]
MGIQPVVWGVCHAEAEVFAGRWPRRGVERRGCRKRCRRCCANRDQGEPARGLAAPSNPRDEVTVRVPSRSELPAAASFQTPLNPRNGEVRMPTWPPRRSRARRDTRRHGTGGARRPGPGRSPLSPKLPPRRMGVGASTTATGARLVGLPLTVMMRGLPPTGGLSRRAGRRRGVRAAAPSRRGCPVDSEQAARSSGRSVSGWGGARSSVRRRCCRAGRSMSPR